jgi:L-lysine exporter family protein LysE/ArgO
LVLSSPFAIVWFAAVGGVLIAQAGGQNWFSVISFVMDFFVAGLCWTGILCAVTYHGSKNLNRSALSVLFNISVGIGFLTYRVAFSGYQALILGISEPILKKMYGPMNI